MCKNQYFSEGWAVGLIKFNWPKINANICFRHTHEIWTRSTIHVTSVNIHPCFNQCRNLFGLSELGKWWKWRLNYYMCVISITGFQTFRIFLMCNARERNVLTQKILSFSDYYLRIEFHFACADGIMNAMVKLAIPWSALFLYLVI